MCIQHILIKREISFLFSDEEMLLHRAYTLQVERSLLHYALLAACNGAGDACTRKFLVSIRAHDLVHMDMAAT